MQSIILCEETVTELYSKSSLLRAAVYLYRHTAQVNMILYGRIVCAGWLVELHQPDQKRLRIQASATTTSGVERNTKAGRQSEPSGRS